MNNQREPAESGKILRSLRGIRPMTGVAREIGISYSMLCKLEYGIRKPGDEMKKKIADYYKVPVESIF